jgi:hypothetical protein
VTSNTSDCSNDGVCIIPLIRRDLRFSVFALVWRYISYEERANVTSGKLTKACSKTGISDICILIREDKTVLNIPYCLSIYFIAVTSKRIYPSLTPWNRANLFAILII